MSKTVMRQLSIALIYTVLLNEVFLIETLVRLIK
jgi:hypothetical protein